jgi:hypothetical protein
MACPPKRPSGPELTGISDPQRVSSSPEKFASTLPRPSGTTLVSSNWLGLSFKEDTTFGDLPERNRAASASGMVVDHGNQ